jgi:Flp pilus assembly protein TadG
MEFAIVAPLFFVLLLGVVGFSLWCGAQIAVAKAAAEGARAAVAGLSTTERQSLAVSAATSVLNSYSGLMNRAIPTIAAQPVANNAALFQVSVRYPFSSVLTGLIAPTNDPQATVTVTIGGY